jgi:Transglutaminase-like superfamily
MSERVPVMPHGRRALSLRERIWLAAEVLVTYCAVRWTVHRHDLPQTLARLRREPDPGRSAAPDQLEAQLAGSRLGYVVGTILGRLPADSRCLMRSLVLTRLLARRGMPSSLVIGVRSAPEFGAHAWVEQGGRPVLPAHGATFGRLVEL